MSNDENLKQILPFDEKISNGLQKRKSKCSYLHSLGYLKVKNLFGGMNNWVGEIE
ncbi:hypothetical protein ACFPES_25575 [Paenibacillus sp. GCM10023248]|uniref:hypothetical protein n=1 Tax=unclassified Paenibacillus TaxID=185978 RepID=UPI002377D458|nr:hypothetical protein [Paenibacillus sp. MAHUQ-63]MDD9270432.1 hypothetical protein [Paenibacillus sp. MAHUQ-63]